MPSRGFAAGHWQAALFELFPWFSGYGTVLIFSATCPLRLLGVVTDFSRFTWRRVGFTSELGCPAAIFFTVTRRLDGYRNVLVTQLQLSSWLPSIIQLRSLSQLTGKVLRSDYPVDVSISFQLQPTWSKFFCLRSRQLFGYIFSSRLTA